MPDWIKSNRVRDEMLLVCSYCVSVPNGSSLSHKQKRLFLTSRVLLNYVETKLTRRQPPIAAVSLKWAHFIKPSDIQRTTALLFQFSKPPIGYCLCNFSARYQLPKLRFFLFPQRQVCLSSNYKTKPFIVIVTR